MVVKCVEIGHSGVYLAVVRALLTFSTVEHFVAHGQCLLFMVSVLAKNSNRRASSVG